MIYKNGREVKRTGAHHRFTPGIPDTEDRSSSGHAAQRDCRIKCKNSNDRKNAEAVPEMGVSPALEQQNHNIWWKMLKQCRRWEYLRH